MDESNHIIGNLVTLRELLKSPNQLDFASIIGIQRLALAKIITGQSQPSKTTLKKISTAFGIPVKYLLEEPKIFQAYIDGAGIFDSSSEQSTYLVSRGLKRDYLNTRKFFTEWKGRYAVYHPSTSFKGVVVKGILDIQNITIHGVGIKIWYPNYDFGTGNLNQDPLVYSGTGNIAQNFIYFAGHLENDNASIINMIAKNDNKKILIGHVVGIHIPEQEPAGFKCVIEYLGELDTPLFMDKNNNIQHRPDAFKSDSEMIPQKIRESLKN